MKNISIHELEELIGKCLTNPGSFRGKSIVLWNAIPAGLADNVIKQCCQNFNENNPEQEVGVANIDLPFQYYDVTNIYASHAGSFAVFKRGIITVTGCLPEDLDDWVSFVNTHENSTGHLSDDWVLIAFADENAYGDHLTEQMFSPNCDIYMLEPSLQEWADWVIKIYSPNVINPIVDFISKEQPSPNFDQWMRFLYNLSLKMEGGKLMKEIPLKDFSLISGGSSFDSDHIAAELWNFINL